MLHSICRFYHTPDDRIYFDHAIILVATISSHSCCHRVLVPGVYSSVYVLQTATMRVNLIGTKAIMDNHLKAPLCDL